MSEPSEPLNALPATTGRPAAPPAAPPPPPRSPGLLGCAFVLSFLVNLAAGAVIVVLLCFGVLGRGLPEDGPGSVPEKHFSGTRTATAKVAIVTIDGPIVEGLLGNPHRQIENAARDDSVKAVVVRVNSPGGSITASDDLYRRLLKLRKGDADKKRSPKPLVASLGSIAASGGYYVAVPADEIYAERSTITGSIGVYASFPNLKELAEKWGVSMNTIKAGAIKDTGSMFRTMTPVEQQMVQDMVDDAYVQFMGVVTSGRPKLTRAKLLERFIVRPLRPDPQAPRQAPTTPYTRYRADGGIFTAQKAKELDLVDAVGDLEDAVVAAAKLAELETYRGVRYMRRPSLTDILLGVRTNNPPASLLEIDRLRAAFTPRLWYLAPGHEAAGLLAAAEAARSSASDEP